MDQYLAKIGWNYNVKPQYWQNLRTKNFEAHFHRKLRTPEKCSNLKKLRTAEPQPIFTGSYKKKKSVLFYLVYVINSINH